ncbi:MAG: hypothetical protein IPO21_21045 [Bacteroidales bacterium]|nr:hypothetical protein [Bacteroidales bacterium]
MQSNILNDIVESEIIKEFHHPHIYIGSSIYIAGQNAVLARETIAVGEILFFYEAPVSLKRTRTSIQIDAQFHLEVGEFGSYTITLVILMRA